MCVVSVCSSFLVTRTKPEVPIIYTLPAWIPNTGRSSLGRQVRPSSVGGVSLRLRSVGARILFFDQQTGSVPFGSEDVAPRLKVTHGEMAGSGVPESVPTPVVSSDPCPLELDTPGVRRFVDCLRVLGGFSCVPTM